MNEQEPVHAEMKFGPSAALIPTVRQFVSSFFERVLGHPAAAARLVLAAHELLDNSAEFALGGESSIDLGVVPRGENVEVSVRTWNRCCARDRENLEAIVSEMREAADPFAYYQRVMRRNARRRDGSGLGLARICAEAEMTLSCEARDDEVSLVARTVLTADERPASSGLPDVAGGTFSVSSTLDDRALTVRFAGDAGLAARSSLEAFLPQVHAEALRAAIPEVVVDLTELEFMNSSCFRCFVSWLSDVQDLPPQQQYRIRLVSNSSMLWQRRSLHALKSFADELIQIVA